MPTTAQQIETVKHRLQTATTRRAQAETAQATARKQYDDIDAAIKKLGFDPATVEQDLDTLEAALDQRLQEALTAVDAEIIGLDAVLAAAKQANVL
jgi:hypothetical protein